MTGADAIVLLNAQLRASWLHSVLFGTDAELPNPGLGIDRVCPLGFLGDGLDADDPDTVAPFTPDQVVGTVGFLLVGYSEVAEPELLGAGEFPEWYCDIQVSAEIWSPRGEAPVLPARYASALSWIFDWSSTHLSPTGAGLRQIQQVCPPPSIPKPEGATGPYAVYSTRFDLQVEYRSRSHVAA